MSIRVLIADDQAMVRTGFRLIIEAEPDLQVVAEAEITGTRHLSLSTVKTHLAAIQQKIGARNRVDIARWAYETSRLP